MRKTAFSLLFLLITSVHSAEPIDPLLVRNTSPVAQLFGVPTFVGNREGQRFTIDHGNIFSGTSKDGVEAVFDGETTVATLAWNHTSTNGWNAGVEVPWVRHTGGALDGFIEGYHDVFGFPDAGRSRAPEDRLLYGIVVDGVTRLRMDDPQSGLGDLRLQVGKTLYSGDRHQLAVRGLVKLPTGEVDRLTGSEGTDVGLWMEYRHADLFGVERLSASVLGGALHLGKSELLPDYQRDVMAFGHLGFGFRFNSRIELLVQADVRSAAYDIESDILGRAALQGTLGGRVRLWGDIWLDLAVAEDLFSKSSPDVIFHVSLERRVPNRQSQ